MVFIFHLFISWLLFFCFDFWSISFVPVEAPSSWTTMENYISHVHLHDPQVCSVSCHLKLVGFLLSNICLVKLWLVFIFQPDMALSLDLRSSTYGLCTALHFIVSIYFIHLIPAAWKQECWLHVREQGGQCLRGLLVNWTSVVSAQSLSQLNVNLEKTCKIW